MSTPAFIRPDGDDLIRDGASAITQNADAAEGLRHWKGMTQLAAGTNLLELESGVYSIQNGGRATDLGMPTATHGILEVYRFGPSGRIQVWRSRSVGDTTTVWQRDWQATDWSEWREIGGEDAIWWHGGSELQESADLWELPAGVYAISNGPRALAMGMPTETHGVLEVFRWSANGRIQVWRTRNVGGTTTVWQRDGQPGGWSEWREIGGQNWYHGDTQLSTHVDDPDLPPGAYTVWGGQRAIDMGLPTYAHGVYNRYRWGTTGGIDQWITSGSQEGMQIWQRVRLSGAMTGWQRIDGLAQGSGRISVWGSSTPAGLYVPLITEMQPFDVTVNMEASGGERSSQTVARIGSADVTLTPTGGTLPATGPVEVTSADLAGRPLNFRPTDGWLGDTYGTLTGHGDETTGHYTFTRRIPGAAVPMGSGAAWVPDVKAPAHLNIYYAGKNDMSSSAGASPEIRAAVIQRRDAAIAYWQSLGQEFLVLGHFINPGTPAHHAGRDALEADNLDAATKYPDNFISLQDLVTGPDLWGFTGITPTQADLDEQALGNLPWSINSDNHLDQNGNAYLAYTIAQWMRTKGFIGQGRIPFTN